jgi:hypothetical protein
VAHCREHSSRYGEVDAAKRTTYRSTSGKKKLYTERDAKGRITDTQRYKRAHGQDVKRQAKAEGKKKS